MRRYRLRARARRLEAYLQARPRARLVQAERMATPGTLAAGVERALNNPLAYIASNLEYACQEVDALERELPEGKPQERLVYMERALREALHGADRVRCTVWDLKALARRDEESHGPVALHVVQEAAAQEAQKVASASPETAAPSTAEPVAGSGGGSGPVRAPMKGRVLVVDDEPMVSAAVRRTLAREHEVEVLASARMALERLVSPQAELVDVVLCDLMMPDLTGMELYAELESKAPSMAGRMVFITGGAFTPAAQQFLERVSNPRLEKPFEPGHLRQLVRSWVEQAREGRRLVA